MFIHRKSARGTIIIANSGRTPAVYTKMCGLIELHPQRSRSSRKSEITPPANKMTYSFALDAECTLIVVIEKEIT